ncbi:MAG: signal peptidase I [Peptostreptococcaceae bacterium]
MLKLLFTIKHLLDFIKEPLLAVLTALLVIQFLFAHTIIPSESMEPTIMTSDRMIINRLPYYYRNPKRGEIVIFKQGDEFWVKRVIGEPGDTLNLIDGYVYINDHPLDESGYLDSSILTFPLSSDISFPFIVPTNTYFVMGDNRLASRDSRAIGPIDRELIVAKGGFRIYPFNAIGLVR